MKPWGFDKSSFPFRLKSVAAVRAAQHLRRPRGRGARGTTMPARHGDVRRAECLWKSAKIKEVPWKI